MKIESGGSSGSTDILVAYKNEMHKTGSTLQVDINNLQSDISKAWQLFEDNISDLPLCLQDALSHFERTQKKYYAVHIKNRLTLAQALKKSADLIEAVDKCCAKSFTDPTLANISLNNILPGQQP